MVLTFKRDADVPVLESFVTADTEEPFSGLALSVVWVLFTPGTLGTEPTLLLAFFILGCLFMMHLQTNLQAERNFIYKIQMKSSVFFFVMLYLGPEVHNNSKDHKLKPNWMHVTDQWVLLFKRNFYQEPRTFYSSTPNYGTFFSSSLSTNGTELRIFYKWPMLLSSLVS